MAAFRAIALKRLIDAAKTHNLVIFCQSIHAMKPSENTTPESNLPKRLGFMAGEISVPDDFDEMGSAEIMAMFYESEN